MTEDERIIEMLFERSEQGIHGTPFRRSGRIRF